MEPGVGAQWVQVEPSTKVAHSFKVFSLFVWRERHCTTLSFSGLKDKKKNWPGCYLWSVGNLHCKTHLTLSHYQEPLLIYISTCVLRHHWNMSPSHLPNKWNNHRQSLLKQWVATHIAATGAQIWCFSTLENSKPWYLVGQRTEPKVDLGMESGQPFSRRSPWKEKWYCLLSFWLPEGTKNLRYQGWFFSDKLTTKRQ